MSKVLDYHKKLVEEALPSGFEQNVGKLLAELAKPFVDEVKTDALGNVIAHKKGSGRRLMMPAHMDTIGFMATYIDEQGFVRFDTIGGHIPVNLFNTPIRFAKGQRGVICAEKIEDMIDKNLKQIKISDLYIDIGASSREEAARAVSVGDVATFVGKPKLINDDTIMSPYLDDLIGCVVLLLAMEQVEKTDNDLYFVFSTQEEVGLRGAGTAAHHINPYMGIAVDVCDTGDTLSSKEKMVVKMGEGPTIKHKDSSLICSPQTVRHLVKAAEKAGVRYQDEVLTAGGTDSGAVQRARGGVFSGCISVPTRNIHSPCEMVSVHDVEQAAKLLATAAAMQL